MSDWIDAEDQLPGSDGRYLAFCGSAFIAWYTKSTKKWKREYSDTGLDQHVTHWMLLPEPPMLKE